MDDMVVTYNCQIQIVMININSHVHEMHLPVLIKSFHIALKCYFI
jgi:hypothetical protein